MRVESPIKSSFSEFLHSKATVEFQKTSGAYDFEGISARNRFSNALDGITTHYHL